MDWSGVYCSFFRSIDEFEVNHCISKRNTIFLKQKNDWFFIQCVEWKWKWNKVDNDLVRLLDSMIVAWFSSKSVVLIWKIGEREKERKKRWIKMLSRTNRVYGQPHVRMYLRSKTTMIFIWDFGIIYFGVLCVCVFSFFLLVFFGFLSFLFFSIFCSFFIIVFTIPFISFVSFS